MVRLSSQNFCPGKDQEEHTPTPECPVLQILIKQVNHKINAEGTTPVVHQDNTKYVLISFVHRDRFPKLVAAANYKCLA